MARLSPPRGNSARRPKSFRCRPVLGELGDSRLRGGGSRAASQRVRGFRRSWSFVRRLKAAVDAFAPDLVHSNGIKTHLLARFAVPAARAGRLASPRLLRPSSRWRGWLLAPGRSRVRAAVAISNAVAVDARAVLPGVRVDGRAERGRSCCGFRPVPATAATSTAAPASRPPPPGTVRVGLVATYARWKGHLTVLDAAAKLAAESPDVAGAVVHRRRADLPHRGAVHRSRTAGGSRNRAVSRTASASCRSPPTQCRSIGPRRRAARIDATRAVRADGRRGDGVRPRGGGEYGRRRGRALHGRGRCTRRPARERRSTRGRRSPTRRRPRASGETRHRGPRHGQRSLRREPLSARSCVGCISRF